MKVWSLGLQIEITSMTASGLPCAVDVENTGQDFQESHYVHVGFSVEKVL